MISRRSKSSGHRLYQRCDWRLLKFLSIHLGVGVASGWIFVGLLIWFDVGGIGSLIATSGVSVLATAMLLIVVAITWGSLSMGTAIFLMPKESDEDRPPRGRKMPIPLHPGAAAPAYARGGRCSTAEPLWARRPVATIICPTV